MNTSQLLCALNCDPMLRKEVVGVYSIDEIPSTLQWGQGFITNTDPHHLPGQHWVCCYITSDGQGEFMDSFGQPPSFYSAVLFDFFNLNSSSFIYNDVTLQSDNSYVCGYYCLYYLLLRCRGVSIHNILKAFSENRISNDCYVYDYITRTFSFCLTNHRYLY